MMKMTNYNVSIQKKILIFFIMMFGIIAAGAVVFWYNAKKSEQQFALAILLKESYLTMDNISIYTNELLKEKRDNISIFKGEIEKLDNYFSVLQNGGSFISSGKYLRVENVMHSHKEGLSKLVNRWDIFKDQIISLTENYSNVSGNKIQIDEKRQLVIEEMDILSEALLSDAEMAENISMYFLLIIVLTAFTGLFLGYHFILNTVIKPLEKITKVAQTLALGENVEPLPEDKNDEVGQLFKSTNLLNKNLTIVSLFAYDIGQGNFDAHFEPRGENDVLGHALLNMRNNLNKAVIEDQKRNWANENLADFAELLRIHSENLEELSYKVVARLVNSMQANQGGFFFLSDDGEMLELKGSYAYNKRKFIEKSIDSSYGLIGQCLQEKKPIYLKEIPLDYMEITSGLGGARPTSLLLLPLIENDNGYGVIEISSIDEMEDYKIKFAEMVAEDIASSLSVLKANEKTKKLLTQSQLKNEKRKNREVSMKQKLVKLEESTQIWRNKELELIKSEKKLSSIIEKAPYSLMILNTSKKIEYFNSHLETFFMQKGIFVGKDLNISQLLPSSESKIWNEYFEKALKGEVITDILNWKHIKGYDIYLQIMINKIDDLEGNFEGWTVRLNEISHLQPIRW